MIQIHPHALDLDVRLIHAPGVGCRFEMRTTTLLQLWRILLDPTEDRGVVNMQASFQHHLFQIAVAESITQIPADAQHNHLRLKVTPFEKGLHCHSSSFLFLAHPTRRVLFLQHNLGIRNSVIVPAHYKNWSASPASQRSNHSSREAATYLRMYP